MKIVDIVKTPNTFDLKKFSEIINWIDKHEVHRNKENYLKILFDRIENTNRPHAAVKIKSVRVVKPNDNL